MSFKILPPFPSEEQKDVKLMFLLLVAFLITSLIIGFKNDGLIKRKQLSTSCKGCNIVIIDIDSLRADALNCDEDRDNTPHICTFSKGAVVFNENVGHSDLTRPSFTSALTSLYPSSHNIWNELYTNLDESVTTLPEILRDNNYKTVLFGFTESNQLIYKGFEETVAVHDIFKSEFNPDDLLSTLLYEDRPFMLYIYLNDLHFPYLPFNNEKLSNKYKAPNGIPTTREEYDELFKDYLVTHYSEVFKQEAIDSNPDVFQGDLTRNRDKIYNLYFEYNMNRATLAFYLKDAWKPYSEAFFKYIDLDNPDHTLYIKSNYLAMLRLIDSKIVRLLDVLSSTQFSNKTIVLIRSNKADGFRGYSYNLFTRNLYQELIHTPLIIKTPQSKPSAIQSFSQDIDIMPTLLDLVGIDIPAQAQGKSLVPLIENPKLSVNDYQIAQKGAGDYISTFRKGDWKLIMKDLQAIELYNLEKDPGEQVNVIKEHGEKALELYIEYNIIISKQPMYGSLEPPFPDWIDEEKRQRLKEEGYF